MNILCLSHIYNTIHVYLKTFKRLLCFEHYIGVFTLIQRKAIH